MIRMYCMLKKLRTVNKLKYPSTPEGYFHQKSLWFGRYNPTIDRGRTQAGACGLWSCRLSISYEPVWEETSHTGMDNY